MIVLNSNNRESGSTAVYAPTTFYWTETRLLVSAILDSQVHRRRAYQPALSNTRQSAPGEILRLAVKTVAAALLWIEVGEVWSEAPGISIPEVCGGNLSDALYRKKPLRRVTRGKEPSRRLKRRERSEISQISCEPDLFPVTHSCILSTRPRQWTN